MRSLRAQVLFAAAVLLAASTARADVIAIADAEVQHLNPNSTFSSQPELSYAGGASHKDTISYIKFDVSQVQWSAITSATIKFSYAYAGDARSDPGDASNRYTDGQLPIIVGLNDGAGDAWSESTLTYNNAPGIDHVGVTGALAGSTTNLGVIYPTSGIAGQKLALGAVLTLRKSFADGNSDGLGLLNFLKTDTNGLVTIMVEEGGAESGRAIYSRQNFSGYLVPTLVLGTGVAAPVPEAGSVALLGVGVVGMLVRRRK